MVIISIGIRFIFKWCILNFSKIAPFKNEMLSSRCQVETLLLSCNIEEVFRYFDQYDAEEPISNAQ